MLLKIKSLYKNKAIRLAMLVVILTAVFGYSGGRFYYVKAFNNRVNIFPGSFAIEQIDNGLVWGNIGNSFYQDLDPDSEYSEFNIDNSAYIMSSSSMAKYKAAAVDNEDTNSGNGDNVDPTSTGEEDSELKINNEELIINEKLEGEEELEEEAVTEEELDNESGSQEGAIDDEIFEEEIPPNEPAPETSLTDEEVDDGNVTPEVIPEEPAPIIEGSVNEPSLESDELSIFDRLFKGFESLVSKARQLEFFDFKLARAQDDNYEEAESDLQYTLLNQNIIFSDFSVPLEYKENSLALINLRLSLAAFSEYDNDYLSLDYSINGEWYSLDKISLDAKISNDINGEYFLFPLSDEIGWEDLENLKIKINYLNNDLVSNEDNQELEIFLDALWLEVDYNSPGERLEDNIEELDDEDGEVLGEEEILEIMSLDEYELNLLSVKRNFKVGERPDLYFRFQKRRGLLGKFGAKLLELVYDEHKNTRVKIRPRHRGQEVEANIFQVNYLGNGEFTIKAKESRQFKPGKYTLDITIEEDGKIFTTKEDFTWGVLAFNVNKSIYLPGETAYLQMGVLDDNGDTICDADLELEIIAPDGGIAILSTDNGLIIRSPECGPNNVINTPDYYGHYGVAGVGVYRTKLTAWTTNGERKITDLFEVQEMVPFEIERIGPTRIYPIADYEVKFKIKANSDFKGKFIEYVPACFKIVEQKQDGAVMHNAPAVAKTAEDKNEKEIVWWADWKAGKEYLLTYTLDAPDISPEFYLLGPAKISGQIKFLVDEESEWEEIDFQEYRQWQIASDATTVYTTSGTDTFTVPAGVSEIVVKAWGAGGAGGAGGSASTGGEGGGAGFASSTIAVTALEVLTIHVGGTGTGGLYAGSNSGGGGGGGGRSEISRTGTSLVIASGGGGGGGGDNSSAVEGGDGGVGGGSTGGNGAASGNAGGGIAGSQVAGGAGGTGGANAGGDGGLQAGGDGANGGSGGDGTGGGAAGGTTNGGDAGIGNAGGYGGGGGGGSGYYGGGGGSSSQAGNAGGGGGGGGSSYASSTVSGSGQTAGNTSDSDYAGSAGQGGNGGSTTNSGNAGNNGRIVIIYTAVVDLTVSATGTQTSTININSEDNYVGGTFVLTSASSSQLTVTDITITESGTVDASSSLENIRLYYDIDSTDPYDCISESYAVGDTQFGATTTNGFSSANGTSTFSGTVNLSASTSMCVYTVLDVNSSADKNETIEIEINNPLSDVILSIGAVNPATSIELANTTTLYSPDALATANEQRRSDNFTVIANNSWTNENQVYLSAYAQSMGSATTSKFDYYFELFNESGTYTTATSAPGSSCVSGTSFAGCSSKIWKTSASTTPWYDTDWEYRKKIIINASQVATTASAFVVLATTTDSDLADTSNGGHVASSTGGDFLLIDSDDTTILDYERVFYSSSTGELIMWIETGVSSTDNKTIYLYYGNSTLSVDQQDRTGTWDSSYALVMHMEEDPGALLDSTGNSNTINDYGNPQPATGQAGEAVDFDGAGDYLLVSDSASLDGTTGGGQPRSWSFWMNLNVAGNNKLITDKSAFSGRHLWSELQAGPNEYRGGVAGSGQLISNTAPNTGEWNYVAYDYDGSQARLYFNGVLDDGPNNQTAPADDNNTLRVMGRGNDAYCTNGILDELVVRNVSRSAAWIETEYNNQRSVGSFLSFQTEESASASIYEGVVNIITIPDRGTNTNEGYKWQVLACDDQNSCSYWDDYNSTIPNFMVDTAPPTAPGNLTLSTTTPTSITLTFGSETVEPNFLDYKIFYKSGISGVDTDDIEWNDSDLDHIDYNSATSTIITGLEANTQYVINIWAYDKAGNKTSATEKIVTTASAPHARARSVVFRAGKYSGNGSTGQQTDTDQVFSTFNFKLAEANVEIESAYILFESQFESYHSGSGDYTGYNLFFDACTESCTANATSGMGRVLKDDNTDLAYDEDESNQIRLLFDVTEETQLAAYAGGGTNMEAQVGYRLEAGTATNSIANASAKLIISYRYDDDATVNFTNTVIYPLESQTSGDQGTTRASQIDDCTKNPDASNDCPLFDYNIDIPELSTKLSQWFEMHGVNDGHGSSDVSININIEGSDVDSDTYIYEAANGGEQGHLPIMFFDNVLGYSESTAQVLEYYLASPGAATYYLLGGEVFETYTAAKSASTKTRTVSFPIGVITNGQSVSTASGSVNVYFPENGSGSGIVDIKKVWFRVKGNDYDNAARTITVSSKVGDNTQSGNSVYNINAGASVIKPAYTIVHVISDSDYTELESANAASPKSVTIYAANSSVNLGGISAELMITYTYSDESSGYLTSLDLFGGQSETAGNAQSVTKIAASSLFPELRGTETVRAAALLSSYSMSASDNAMPGAWFTLDTNIATSSPVCVNVFASRDDSINSFTEYYRDVTSAITAVDNQAYSVCISNTNGSNANAGAKMNAIWKYTYQWDAPPSEFTQSDSRWYQNVDSSQPSVPLAAENTAISGVNLGEAVRLRINVGITKESVAASTKTFKLQFGSGASCSVISAWTDVDGLGGSAAWRGYNNPDPIDGVTLSATLLSSSTVVESYEETNNSVSNPSAIPVGGYGEWDWTLYNNDATSSALYCFRMVNSDGTELDDYLLDGFPQMTTAPANTGPDDPISLDQFKNDEITSIANLGWINENTVKLNAAAIDPNISDTISLYFEIASSSGSYTTATSVPSGACLSGIGYYACASRIWVATSTAGDYRTNPFVGTTSVTSLPDYAVGYKWQVMACDAGGDCSDWVQYNASTPNFKVDITPPTPPGNLSFVNATAVNIRLAFGASATEDNFDTYKIYYRVGTAGVTEGDTEHNDGNLASQNYNTATSTLVDFLTAGTDYVFNIFAYDLAGNKATATVELAASTTSAFTPPNGSFFNAIQKTDGSGEIDVTLLVDDADNDDTLRAKILYQSGTACNFNATGTFNQLTVSTDDADTSATYGDPEVDNNHPYQVGTSTGWILTSPGSNYVFFDWTSKTDIPAANGTYCLGLVVNDGSYNQIATDTRLIIVDNVAPSAPGQMSSTSKNYTSVTLEFGSQSSDTRFDKYKIFYKEGTSGVTESDSEHIDSNLNSANYGGATTTTVTGLNPNTWYVFNIYAYDTRGNKASSTKVVVKTNAAPTNISADNQYLSDGITLIANNSWIDEDGIKLKASAHDQDATDLVTFYYELISATGTYSSISTPPGNTCAYNTAYNACGSKVWAISTTSSDLPTDWYDSNWLFRKKITINASAVATMADDFPVLATTTDSDLVASARPDGYDILFTDSSGTSTIPYEREYFNNSTGELVAWIKTDISSTTDTEIYMYYGNVGATTDNATTTGVWDDDFMAVYHLEENVVDEGSQVGAHEDSTINNNDADQEGNNEAIGTIYQGQDFEGINDYINIDDHSTLDLDDAMTAEFWMKGVVTYPPTASTSVYTTPGSTTFTVPDGVTEITIKTWGGGGGGGAGSSDGGNTRQNTGGHGGGGGFAQATFAVNPGETISLHVGGGGAGGTYSGAACGDGGGGGGRTEIARGPDVFLVASGGGGGGGGDNGTYISGGAGGAGGGTAGIAGGTVGGGSGGGGGTQSAGGTAGAGTNNAQAGAYQAGGDGADGRNAQGADGGGGAGGTTNGGDGGNGNVSFGFPGGGAGGSGYYGGGGGGEASNGGAGGGGGSSYATSTLTSTSTEAGSNRDAGNNDDGDYTGDAGQGGLRGDYIESGTAGDDGRIVISFTPGISILSKGSNAYQINYNDDLYLSAQINSESTQVLLTEGWHYIAMTYDRLAGGNEELKLFVDGVVVDTADYSTAINTNNDPIKIGEFLDGIIDEFNISSVARSPAWIKTRYDNQRAVSSFLSFSSESTVTSFYETMLVITIPDNPDYSSGYKWQVMACDDDNDCTIWDKFNLTTPNIKVDTTDPSAPGQLVENTKTSNSVTLNFGAQTDEDNFIEYKIFYSTSSPVLITDSEHNDSDLDYIDYNSTSNTTVSGLISNTTYYFNIWAYDVVNHTASSTITSVTTNSASSTPGAMFYTKNDRRIYYQIWDGIQWGAEQSSEIITAMGNNIRHLRTIRSDDKGKIGLIFKTWNGSSQQWWAVIYRFAADDFVNFTQLGSSQSDATNNHLITSCVAPLSGSEFMIIRNNNASDGTLVYSWNPVDGWTSEGAGPDPGAVLNGCELIRRPGTDNYILMTFDDDADVGSAYYYGGSSYANSWTTWQQHSGDEEDTDNYVGEAFFDPSDNTRGALYYSNSTSNNYTYAKYFIAGNTTFNFGGAQPSPSTGGDDWGNDFVQGEFSADPGGTGIAYFVGRDTGGELNAYKLDITNPTISWSTTTNGDNITSSDLYSETNDAQKPFTIGFYKSGKALVLANYNTNPSVPVYSVITTADNSLSATSTVTGAGSNLYPRVRLYDDPNEDEMLAIYQNDDIDYSAVFFDGGNNQFYAAGNQAWSERVTAAGASSANEEVTTFAYTGYNSSPSVPTGLIQYKGDNTILSNQAWSSTSTIKFKASVIDKDTAEVVTLYVQALTNIDTFATSTSRPNSACEPGETWDNCNSKIWVIATSTSDDYSYVPFTATATITSINDSTIGYKWQVIACDDNNACSAWKLYNAATPNFYVDTIAPTAPGALSITSKTSDSVTLFFGAASTETNFDRYRIYYKEAASGVTRNDIEHSDNDLLNRLYNTTIDTVVISLSSSTQYVFNIFAFDLAGNIATATPEVATTTSAAASMSQSSYLLENDDGANVNNNTAEGAASTSLSNVHIGERINARIQVENIGGDSADNIVYRLQYENQTDNPDTWTDVGVSTEISYSLGLSGGNGNSITSSKAAASSYGWTAGTWHENTNQTGSFTIGFNEYTEFVFAIETSNAATNTTYRLRLYNVTDSEELDDYSSYPIINTETIEISRYSKQNSGSLLTNTNDLTYYLDPEGYTDLSSDDNNRDEISASAFAIYNFVIASTSNTAAITATWNGQSSVAPSTNNIILQVYRFGSTNAWVTIDTESTAAANTDFNLTGNVNADLDEFYDTSFYTYWRVYQVSGTQILRTDYFNLAFSPPVPEVEQIHYRWRHDDGSETTATWLEAEDTGNPTASSALDQLDSIRLRIAIVNIGGGTASNYNYRLEYASSSVGCASDPGYWEAIPVNATTEHFEMNTSSNFGDGDPTTATTTNSESYSFVAGDMVEDPSNATGNVSLDEDEYSELEYMVLITNNAVDGETYCFRVTNSGSSLNSYDIYPSLTLGGSTNVAPSFTAGPSDGGSASTSPTDFGDDVDFTGTASDGENNDYYLAVCQTDIITPGVNASPTCSGGEWCISSSTNSTVQASCSYTAATSSESLDWYAFVCDKVPGFGVAKCSVSSQGTGNINNDSPFVVNHQPGFTSVTTTQDNQNPGGTFIITAYATDTDTADGADNLRLHVCSSNSANYAGCTGENLCSDMSSSTPNASCSFATSTPALAGAWAYYAFVFDSHGLAASANSRSSTYTVNNQAPNLGTLVLNSGADITLNIRGAADKDVSTVNANVVDYNGCSTLVSATAVIYMSDVDNDYSCTGNNNDCYQVGVGDCAISDCDGGTDMSATFICTTSLKYYAVPTDNATNNPNEPNNWLSYINIYDGSSYTATTSPGVEVETSMGLTVTEDLINFGDGYSDGENTGDDNATTTVINSGNSPIDTNLSGTDMSGNPSGTLTVDNIKWSLDAFDYTMSGTVLTSGGENVDTVTPKATTSADVLDKVYWGIGIPFGSDRSTYTGQNSFQVLLDNNGW